VIWHRKHVLPVAALIGLGSLALIRLLAVPAFEDEGTQLRWIRRIIDAAEWLQPLNEGKPLEAWLMVPWVWAGLRGLYYRWLFFAAGPIESAVTNKALGFETPQGREVMAGWGTFAAVMDAMESALSPGPYILGERFSAADVYFGSQIGFGLMFNSIEKRPAGSRAREIDDALIAKPKQ
jgi:glutathione S-transferase